MLELEYETLMDTIDEIGSKLDDYNAHVSDLKVLSDKISSSTDWIDEAIKPTFISYLNSYIEIYKAVAEAIAAYQQFMTKKLENFNEHESKFS
ncbi:MAG TPA: hypothetical protein IAC02_01025 [Candidatus Coprovivens excrementavium]|nr:hypothetical protein [Candidatus Coprovivens excrementavium]